MSADALPLRAYPMFRVDTINRLAETVHNQLSATLVQVAAGRPRIDACGNRFDLPTSSLWACGYGMELRLSFPAGQPLRIHFQRRGAGAVHAGDQAFCIDGTQSAIFAGAAETEFRADFQQVVWRVPPDLLAQKLMALTGSPVGRPLQLAPVLPLATPQAQAMLQTLNALLALGEAGPSAATRLMASELENVMLVGLLCSARHNYRALLDRGSPAAAPWQVYRAESFIEANWNKPIVLDDIMAATGASARSVFRAFRQSRGYTPWQFAKHVRLRHAQRMLQDSDPALSVTEVALACGFADLSSFSREFARTFGVPPSYWQRQTRSAGSAGC